MIPLVVRQSVILKCKLQKSVLVGNYEYYYAAGLFSRLAGVQLDAKKTPEELKEQIAAVLPDYQPSDPRELHLKRILTDFHPGAEKSEEMDALFLMGVNEAHLWEEKGIS